MALNGEQLADLRILVVEDHGFQRWMLSNLLESLGAQFVYSAADGAEALEILDHREPQVDVIITDLDMPGMDGLEFIRHLGHLRYPAALILASAMQPSLVATVEMMAAEYGVALLGSIPKPVTAKKLRAVLEADAAQRRLETQPIAQFGVEDVARGLRQGEFIPFFQPQVDLVTQKMKGAEALVRWRHPVFRVVRPSAFLAAVESSPLMAELTWMMLREAAAGCAQWRKAGVAAGVSVNVSLRSMQDFGFADRLVALVKAAGLEPGDLTVEITESAAAGNLGEALEIFGRLRMRGFGLSIDDFGTGYSSMKRLAHMPFTELKIDRTFVSHASTQPPSRAMLESSLDAAQRLGITSIAEGVENRGEWELVRALRCDLAQGYYVARPMDAGEVLRWAEAHSRATA